MKIAPIELKGIEIAKLVSSRITLSHIWTTLEMKIIPTNFWFQRLSALDIDIDTCMVWGLKCVSLFPTITIMDWKHSFR
jgi:hypothetical protein